MKKLYRSRDNRIFCGVAGGVGAYLNLDPSIVRVLWVVALLAGIIPAVFAYAACCFLIPDEPIIEGE